MELSAEERTNINKIAQKNGYTNFKIKVEKGSNKGDNFVGIISRVTIEDNDEKFDVILKSTQKIEALKKVQPTRKLFLREIYLYEKIFADYAAFEEEYNVPDRFSAHAKLLGTCEKEDDEHLILEDMKQKGYGMWNKRVTMNSNHIEAVLKEYGKFHSISLAMNKLRPEHFHELTKDLDEVFGGEEGKQQEMTEFMKNLMKNAYKAVEGDQEAVEAIKKYEQTLPDIFRHISDDDNIVVTHGDCWCNNFLFKYQGNNTENPAEICILDWQLSKLGSPGIDLCYFLLANGSEEVLDNYQKYLKIYYDTVSERLTYFSCKSDEILTFEQLEQMFRRCCKFFFAFCTMIMRIQMSESHEVPEFSDNVEKEEMFDTFANFTISNEDEFNRRMAILTRFMMKYSMF